MRNSTNRWIVGMVSLFVTLGLSSPASALSVSLEFSGGASTLAAVPGSTGLTVDLFAYLSAESVQTYCWELIDSNLVNKPIQLSRRHPGRPHWS